MYPSAICRCTNSETQEQQCPGPANTHQNLLGRVHGDVDSKSGTPATPWTPIPTTLHINFSPQPRAAVCLPLRSRPKFALPQHRTLRFAPSCSSHRRRACSGRDHHRPRIRHRTGPRGGRQLVGVGCRGLGPRAGRGRRLGGRGQWQGRAGVRGGQALHVCDGGQPVAVLGQVHLGPGPNVGLEVLVKGKRARVVCADGGASQGLEAVGARCAPLVALNKYGNVTVSFAARNPRRPPWPLPASQGPCRVPGVNSLIPYCEKTGDPYARLQHAPPLTGTSMDFRTPVPNRLPHSPAPCWCRPGTLAGSPAV